MSIETLERYQKLSPITGVMSTDISESRVNSLVEGAEMQFARKVGE